MRRGERKNIFEGWGKWQNKINFSLPNYFSCFYLIKSLVIILLNCQSSDNKKPHITVYLGSNNENLYEDISSLSVIDAS